MQRNKTTWIPFCPNLEAYGPIKCNKASFVDAKLDGEYAVWFKNGIFNKNGVERIDFPAAEMGKLLASALIDITRIEFEHLQILGELHWEDGKAGDLYRLLSNKLSDDLNFTVFDFRCDHLAIMDRREMLVEAFKKTQSKWDQSTNLRLVPFKYCEKGEVDDAYQSFINDGYEGVVIKPILFKVGFKRKAVETSDLKVLSADQWRARIGLEHPSKPGVELCGCKLDYPLRHALVGHIVEIKYLQKLYNEKGELTGLRSPSFLRVRDDKAEVSL